MHAMYLENVLARQIHAHNGLVDCVKTLDSALVKNMRKVRKINRRCIIASGVTMLLISGLCSVYDEHEKKIAKLTEEVEALKNQKGE